MLLSRWEDFHEQHRPSMVGFGPSANARQHFAHGGHEREELSRRFAREVAAWIRQSMDHEPERSVIVFSAPRFLGDLRDALADRRDPADRRAEAHLFRNELSGLRASEVAAHPSVRALVACTTPRLAATARASAFTPHAAALEAVRSPDQP